MTGRDGAAGPEPSGEPELLESDHGPVRVLTLNRPDQRNAFTVGLYQALAGALRRADADESVRAAVVTGAGAAFTGGTDLGELAAIAAGQSPPGADQAFPRLLDALAEVDLPLVAAVNGPGVGLGATMLTFFDLVYISETARLMTPFAAMGVPPEAASSYLFPARMGWQPAARMLLTGEWLTAGEAVATGLATAACPAGSVLSDALAAAQRVAAHDRSATRTIKSLMRAGERPAAAEARRRENQAYAALFGRSS